MVFLSGRCLALAGLGSRGCSNASAMARIRPAIEKFSAYNPSPLSLEAMMQFGSKENACEKKSFLFLRKELPVRLANIMKELSLLPDDLRRTPSVQLLDNWYQQSFLEMIDFESSDPTDQSTLDNFTEILNMIRTRHSNVVETMAQGVIELKDAKGIDHVMEHNIQYFLDRFYISRISIRMLINQHTILFGNQLQHPRHIGSIDPTCDVVSIVRDAYENAKYLCEHYYAGAPEMNIFTRDALKGDKFIHLPYVPSHLYHMLFELFKNAMRAVVEHHDDDDSYAESYPPLDVMVVKAGEDLTVKISDEGGGIPRSQLDLLFNYMYSTAPKPGVGGQAPIAGYGYGLPLSRLYARYFQGDLVLNSVEGFGTNAVIFLKTLSTDANELLPIYNKTSYKHYKMAAPNPDWSAPMPGQRQNHPNAPTQSIGSTTGAGNNGGAR